MMYDELIEQLRIRASWLEFAIIKTPSKTEGNRDAILFRKAAYAINDLITALTASNEVIAKSKPRWIPVTERLPECDLGAEVGNIEWIICGMVHAGCFGRGGRYRDAYFRTWTDAKEGIDAKEADYWRAVTFPEPPKEET